MTPLISLVVFISLGSGSVVDFQARFYETLHTGESTAVDCQRELASLLAFTTVCSPEGIAVSGCDPEVRDVPLDKVRRDVGQDVPLLHCFDVRATGPEPIHVILPPGTTARELEVYYKAAPGVYVRADAVWDERAGRAAFTVSHPGRFVVREVDERSLGPGEAELEDVLDKGIFQFDKPSSDSEAKSAWRLAREAPDAVDGPIPVLLIHGLGSTRWGDFIHWAAHSPDAAEFRARFQIWNFMHSSTGVDAATGYSSAFPGFSESAVAYLQRFLIEAETDGIEQDGARYVFPPGPFAIVAHSHGGLEARAFLVNFPDRAERLFAAVTLGSPHTGSPWATPEWLRHTIHRLGFSGTNIVRHLYKGALSELILMGYLSVERQQDLDAGWANFDRAGGFGIPYTRFLMWRPGHGVTSICLSPRDANQTDARSLPGYNDNTFEPEILLDTYCGGIDEITPEARGGMHMDKFFLYGGYLETTPDWERIFEEGFDAFNDTIGNTMGNLGLRAADTLMGYVKSEGGAPLAGTYQMSDGFVPLQSQLMLDGRHTELIYKTRRSLGWVTPALPLEPREDIIHAHTLASPERLRILRGWSHLDLVTGRYRPESGKSELFSRVTDDLISAIP